MQENDFTYESSQPSEKLETYEWDNIWWEHAPEQGAPRGLIIGDSISCGYRRMVTRELNETLYIDGLGTSKALDNAFYPALIDYVICQQGESEILQFNNGLHGWHLTAEEYRYHYRKIIEYIMKKYSEKRIILALTTPVRERDNQNHFAARNAIVLERNRIVKELAEEKGLVVNDLYAAIVDKPELWRPDGVHLLEEGYAVLAKQTAAVMRK